jgi:hypothetical protein
MRTSKSFLDLPQAPGVYALFGGRGGGHHVAYVGIGSKVRTRVQQHLLRRNSSVTTGESVVSLNPDLVTEVRWWCRDEFDRPGVLEAAEQVAFEVLSPTLRSRGRLGSEAEVALRRAGFRERMVTVFEGDADGRLTIPTMADALERLAKLEDRVQQLEDAVKELTGRS